MKKISFMALVGILSVAPVFAEFAEPTVAVVTEEVVVQNNSKGGFVNDKETIVTVKQVNEMRDDVPVIVQGHILQRMGDEKYLFEDSTGSITVEIDDDDWRGQTISPSDTVKLYGEVDRGIFKTQIEVDHVKKI